MTVATANTKTRNPEPGKNQSKMSTPMAFGRHETFHIRDGWLAKGVYALSTNPRDFTKQMPIIPLGSVSTC